MKGDFTMKKLLMVLLSILVILTGVVLEGGNISILFVPTAMFILFFGVLFSTLFTFKFSEIINAFVNAFSKDNNTSKLEEYKISLSIVKCMSKLTLNWSFATVILGLIFILSNLTTPSQLGKSVAVICLALLYGFAAIAIIFTPMEHSLNRKLDL